MTYLTLDQAQDVVSNSHPPGTIAPWSEFRHVHITGRYKSCVYVLVTKITCLDPWSETQRIRCDGLLGTVWLGFIQVKHFLLHNQHNLADTLALLLQGYDLDPKPVVGPVVVEAPPQPLGKKAKKRAKKAKKEDAKTKKKKVKAGE